MESKDPAEGTAQGAKHNPCIAYLYLGSTAGVRRVVLLHVPVHSARAGAARTALAAGERAPTGVSKERRRARLAYQLSPFIDSVRSSITPCPSLTDPGPAAHPEPPPQGRRSCLNSNRRALNTPLNPRRPPLAALPRPAHAHWLLPRAARPPIGCGARSAARRKAHAPCPPHPPALSPRGALRTLRSAAPPRRAPPAHFPPAEPPLPLRKSRNAPRSHLWPPPPPLRPAPGSAARSVPLPPEPPRDTPSHPRARPGSGAAATARGAERERGHCAGAPPGGPSRAGASRCVPAERPRAAPRAASASGRRHRPARPEPRAEPSQRSPGSAQSRAAPEDTPGQRQRGRSANAAREQRGARGSLRGAAEPGNSGRRLGLAKNCDPRQLFAVSAVLKTRAKESLVVCVGVYKWFRIGKKKMSGRRVAAACDRRQLPRGMGSMAAPLLDPRPLRLPFLEADVSRTRGGDGLRRGRGRARPQPRAAASAA